MHQESGVFRQDESRSFHEASSLEGLHAVIMDGRNSAMNE